MSVTVGLTVAALSGLVCAVPAVVLLARAGARETGRLRRGYAVLAVAVGVGPLGLLVSALPFGWESPGADPVRLLPFGIGIGLSALGLAGGLLHLPGAAPGTVLRRGLDGALLAACTLHVSWTLVIEPLHVRDLKDDVRLAIIHRCALLVISSLGAFLVFGVAVVLALLARPPRGALRSTCVLAVLAAIGGVLTVDALRYHSGTPALWCGVGYAACLLWFAVAARHHSVVTEQPARPLGAGTLLALVPASMAIGAAIVRVVVVARTDNISIAIAAVVGGLLAARQTVAGQDAFRYARELEEREARMREMAYTDPLTGLANRRRLLHTLHAEHTGPSGYVLLSIDLDGFKSVNDLRGHDVGDDVLVEVGRRLRSDLRPGDLAVRLGGDEFAVLVSAGLDEAYRVAQRLLRLLGRPYRLAGTTLFLSASIGLATRSGAPGVAGLLHNADLALRSAKLHGKNRVERYDAEYDSGMKRRTLLENDLRSAIDRDELSLVYQPVIELPASRAVGIEALLRWRHPQLGMVSPGEFIPLAEGTGMIGMLDRWVMHEACRQLARWRAEGIDIWMAVNISARELHFADYVQQVREVTRAHRVPPESLVLEVTEHAIAVDHDEMIERLRALRHCGVRIALDDFGAGYSSLGHLRDLPVDILKIDHSLLSGRSASEHRMSGRSVSGRVGADARHDPGELAGSLVDVVVRLGQRLGLSVIAEGVAGPEQRRLVEAAGATLVQGDLYGAAAPAERVEAMLVAASRRSVPAPRPAQDLGQVDWSAGHASE